MAVNGEQTEMVSQEMKSNNVGLGTQQYEMPSMIQHILYT